MSARTRRIGDDELRARLTSIGLRVTVQRMTLLRELARQEHPVSHAELTEVLTGSGLDRATIYRNLVSLHEEGMIVRTQLGDNIWRYELPKGAAQEHGEHAHFVCTECGEIECLSKTDVTLRGAAARNEVTDIQVRGRCSACRRG